jgi:hypothetical protein
MSVIRWILARSDNNSAGLIRNKGAPPSVRESVPVAPLLQALRSARDQCCRAKLAIRSRSKTLGVKMEPPAQVASKPVVRRGVHRSRPCRMGS